MRCEKSSNQAQSLVNVCPGMLIYTGMHGMAVVIVGLYLKKYIFLT